MANRKGTKEHTTICKTLHRKQKIEQTNPTKNRGVNSDLKVIWRKKTKGTQQKYPNRLKLDRS
jgi:hypothetical protein